MSLENRPVNELPKEVPGQSEALTNPVFHEIYEQQTKQGTFRDVRPESNETDFRAPALTLVMNDGKESRPTPQEAGHAVYELAVTKRDDGFIEKSVTKRPDGSQEVVQYKLDGSKTIMDSKTDGSSLTTMYRPDGSKQLVVSVNPDKSQECRFFDNHGRPSALLSIDAGGRTGMMLRYRADGSREDETVFHKNGTYTRVDYNRANERTGERQYDSKTNKPISGWRP